MDNQDFDKIFAEGLGKEQEFDFRESDWMEVEEVIQAKSKDRLIWWRWLIPVLFLLFGGIIYCLLTDLREAKSEVLELTEKISRQTFEAIDTQYKKVTILEYDTIRKTIVQENIIERNIYKAVNPQHIGKETQLTKESTLEKANLQERKSYENLEKPIPVSSLSEIPLKEVSLDFEEENEHYYLDEKQFPEKKKGLKDRLKIGLTNAWGFSEGYSRGDSLPGFNGFSKKIVFDLGLRGEWQFNNRLRVRTAVSLGYILFNTSDVGETLRLSERVPADPEGELANARISQTTLNYQLGIKYFLGEYKKWIPYVGLSMEARARLNQKIRASYHYVYQLPNTKSGSFKNSDLTLNSFIQFIGYEYQFSDRFSWQVEGWHQFNFKKEIDKIYPRFGIRNTLLYHF